MGSTPLINDRLQLDVKHLRYFVAVVDAGSVSAAARLLNLAQPALTSRLQRIEDEMGVELLVRSTRGVTPTEEGRVFYVGAKRLLRDLGDVASAVRIRGRLPAGHVSVGFAESAAAIFAQPFLSAAFAQLPNVHLTFAAGQSIDVYRRLISGELDLAIISTTTNVHGLRSRPLVSETLFLGVSTEHDPLVGQDTVSLDALQDLDIVLPTTSIFSVEEMLRRASGSLDYKLRVVAEVDSLDVLTALVATGRASSILGWSAMHRRVLTGEVTLKTIADGGLRRSFEVCRPIERTSNSATNAVERLVISAIREVIANGVWRHAELS